MKRKPPKKRPGEVSSFYNAWKTAVKKRDGHRCQMPGCNKFSYKNHAHHIRMYASHPELRYVISNGITLCYACHKKVTGKEELYAHLFLKIIMDKIIKNGKSNN